MNESENTKEIVETPQTAVAKAMQPAAMPPPPPAPIGAGTIDTFASAANFGVAQRMARALAESSLVPVAYHGNIANCMIALELAARIGCSPFMAMQNLDIIHGRPGWRATFLIATVNASKRFTPLRPRMEGKPGTDSWGCRAVAKDRETGEECVGPLINIAMAKEEGWFGKKGSKWQTLPELMLTYRAAAFWTRIYAPELSLGMHTSDELGDIHGSSAGNLPESLTPASAKLLEQALLDSPQPVAIASAAPASERGVEAEEAPQETAQEQPARMREPGED